MQIDDDDFENEAEAAVLSKGSRLTELQREATEWMAEREVDAGGGLLTDEMGLGTYDTLVRHLSTDCVLGKTLSVLYTVAQQKLSNPCEGASGKTLIACPPILFDTWESEIRRHIKPHLLRVARYGTSDDRDSLMAAREGRIPKHADVVLTSYNRLFLDLKEHLSDLKLHPKDKLSIGEKLLTERHFRRNDRAMLLGAEWFLHRIDQDLITVNAPLAKCGLFSIKWRRVVLDEAHKACNPETKTFAAAMCLAAEYRWWVTGTPIQNRYTDAVSPLLFLREPSICKEIPEAPVREVRIDQTMTDQEWRASKVFPRWAFGRTIQGLMDQREDLLRNDPLLRYMVELEFNIFEHAVAFRHPIERAAHLKHVRRLRRVAQLLADRGGEGVFASVAYDAKRQVAPLEAKEEAAVRKEVDELLQGGKKEGDVLLAFYIRARQVCVDLRLAGEPPLPNGQLSTKMQLLLDDVRQQRRQNGEKFIVFSEWVEALDLAAEALRDVGKIKFVMLHGRMPMKQRRDALRIFKEDPSVVGICMQIDCGGLGLTITEANRIYTLEPMLNPQREKQAFGRIRRPGQIRHMTVTYLMVARSIEEIVRSTAANKLRLAERMQGRRGRAALSTLDVLRDVNLLLLQGDENPAYRERNGELEYRQGLEQRRQYEIPPGFETTLSRRQIQDKVRVFLGAFAAYNAVRAIPASSVVFRLTTRHRDASDREKRRQLLENINKPSVATPGARGEAPVDSIAVALDPFKLQRWLGEELFRSFRGYEAEHKSRRSTPFADIYEISNFDELSTLVEAQNARQGYSNVDPLRANTPSDFLRMLSLVAKPMLVVHHVMEALIADRQAYGAYDARNADNKLVEVRGDAATRLRDSALYPGTPVNLDLQVLTSFCPMWIDPVLSDLLPRPSVAMGAPLFANPASLWIKPPAVPDHDQPPIEPQILNRSQAGRDGTSFMRDVSDFLLLAMAQAIRDADASILTALLATLLVVPVETDSLERRLFIAKSSTTGSILGIASAIVVRNVNVKPSRPVVAIVAPAVYVSLQFRETPDVLRGIAGRLGRALISSLFDAPNLPGGAGLTYSVTLSPSTIPALHTHYTFRARLVAAQRGFVSFIEKSKQTDGGNTDPRFQFTSPPAVVTSSGINWPCVESNYIDGFLTWQQAPSPTMISANTSRTSSMMELLV